jgi:PAS domain S-box-containing protein
MPKSIVPEKKGTVEVSFQTLAENTPIGIYKTDAEGHRTYVNKTWREITGRTEEEAYGFGWARAIFSEDRQRVIDTWKNSVANQTEFKFEFRFDNPLKGLRWVRNQATPLRDSEGNINGYIGSIEDITQQKLSEQNLLESEKRYRLLSENSNDITALTNTKSEFVYLSPSVFSVLGYYPDELIGTRIIDLRGSLKTRFKFFTF